MIPLLRSLNPRSRQAFVLAAVVFLTGALVFEGIGGLMIRNEIATPGDFVYEMRRLAEEGCEMIGVAIFNVALFREIARRRLSLGLEFFSERRGDVVSLEPARAERAPWGSLEAHARGSTPRSRSPAAAARDGAPATDPRDRT